MAVDYAALVRSKVALASRLTDSLKVDITITPQELDGEGAETPGTPVAYRGFVERRQQQRRDSDGRMVEFDQRVLIPGNVEVSSTDAIADDAGPLGPILFIGGFRDPAGGVYVTEIWCGSNRGGSLGTG